MGQSVSTPGHQPVPVDSSSVRHRIRSSLSNRFTNSSSTSSQNDSSRLSASRRRSSLMSWVPTHRPQSPTNSSTDSPINPITSAQSRGSRLFRRARSSLNSVPTVFSRRSPSQARDSSSSLLLTSFPPDIQTTSARNTLTEPPDLNIPASPGATDSVLDLTTSDPQTTSSMSPAGRRRSHQRPSSLISERLQSLRSDRIARTVSNGLRRRRPASSRSDDQLPALSELLSHAAAATAASLMNNDPNAVRNARGIGGDEGTLESFLESLQNGRMASALNQNASNDGSGSSGINFIRLFRFPSSTDVSQTESTRNRLTQGDSPEDERMVPIIIVGIRSINPNPGANEEHTIPSLIDALTNFTNPLDPLESSVDLGATQPNSTRFSHRRRASMGGFGSYDNQRHHRSSETQRPFSAATSETSFAPRPPPSTPASTGLSAFSSGATTPTPPTSHAFSSPTTGPSRTGSLRTPNPMPDMTATTAGAEDQPTRRTPRHRRLSESDFTRFGSGNPRRNGVVEPDDSAASEAAGAGARSWIIYVLGGAYPENHPLLNTPSLFTDSPTYEDMLLLSSLLGPAKPPVASESEVKAAKGLFKIKIGTVQGSVIAEAVDGSEVEEVTIAEEETCLVCLCGYEPDEEARRLVKCRHMFHKSCIDEVCLPLFWYLRRRY